MKRLIVAFVAVGAVMALRPVLKRRMMQKMREHCGHTTTQQEEHSQPVATV